MPLTDLQRKTIKAIVNIFETGQVAGDYGNVTLAKNDTGHLTYGRSQTTLSSGNLYLLIKDYCAAPGAKSYYTDSLSAFLPQMKAKDIALDTNMVLRGLLHAAGTDPVMDAVQDAFFDRIYFTPALSDATRLGLQTAISMALVYDGHIQGSWGAMARRTIAKVGKPAQAGENTWSKEYAAIRRAWLAGNANPALHPCVYRMDAMLALIAAGNWSLTLPLTVHGTTITAAKLGDVPPAPAETGWTLRLNATALGTTWQNVDDQGRNYFPLRTLLSALFGQDRTMRGLRPGATDASKPAWEGKDVPCPVLARADGQTWVQIQAFAVWMGLSLRRDVSSRSIILTRV